MNKKILFNIDKDEDGYPPISNESLWAIEKGIYYKIDNIPFYTYDISLGDIVSVKIEDEELWFKDVIEFSSNSTIRLYCPNDILWEKIKNELSELNCKWETTVSLKTINVPKMSLENTLLYLKNIREEDSDFDYEEASLR